LNDIEEEDEAEEEEIEEADATAWSRYTLAKTVALVAARMESAMAPSFKPDFELRTTTTSAFSLRSCICRRAVDSVSIVVMYSAAAFVAASDAADGVQKTEWPGAFDNGEDDTDMSRHASTTHRTREPAAITSSRVSMDLFEVKKHGHADCQPGARKYTLKRDDEEMR